MKEAEVGVSPVGEFLIFITVISCFSECHAKVNRTASVFRLADQTGRPPENSSGSFEESSGSSVPKAKYPESAWSSDPGFAGDQALSCEQPDFDLPHG
jgi:hypothetical protein